MNRSRFRPRIESLESRRLLAGDAFSGDTAAMEVVAEIVAADVNADGFVSARDALEIINEINLAEAGFSTDAKRIASNVDAVLSRLDVDGNGKLTTVDALRVINRLNSAQVSLIDSVMEMIPQPEGESVTPEIAEATRSAVQESVSGLLDELNELRSEVRLSREQVSEVIGEVIDLVQDQDLSFTERRSEIRDRIVQVIDEVVDGSAASSIVQRVQSVFDSLPESVSSFIDVYRETTADGAFTDSELTELRGSAGEVLGSFGIDGDLADRLLAGFNRLIRLRF